MTRAKAGPAAVPCAGPEFRQGRDQLLPMRGSRARRHHLPHLVVEGHQSCGVALAQQEETDRGGEPGGIVEL